MLSKLPKPDTRATYLIAAANGLPALKVVYEGEVKGSDIKWNNSLGKLTFYVQDDKSNRVLASCHIGQFTGNCGAKYIAHLNIQASLPKEDRAKVLKLIESWAFHETNCSFIVGSDTTYPSNGNTITTILAVGEGYTKFHDVANPNWHHKTALFWKDIIGSKQQHPAVWAGRKVEALS